MRYGLSNPPAWGDAQQYLREMGKCRYYLSLGRWITGAGQALCDAASLGCLCIGEADKVFHRMICHPHCLCKDLSELPQRVRALAASPELQREVRQRQDEALRQQFVDAPLRDLEQATALKRKRK